MWPAMTQHHLLSIFYIAQSTAFFIVIVKLENIGENWRVSLCFSVVLFMLLIKILSKVTHLVGRWQLKTFTQITEKLSVFHNYSLRWIVYLSIISNGSPLNAFWRSFLSVNTNLNWKYFVTVLRTHQKLLHDSFHPLFYTGPIALYRIYLV